MRNKYEDLLLWFDDIIDGRLDYMIFGSSLLGLIREGKLRDDDNEVDVCFHGEDFDEIESSLKASGYLTCPHKCPMPHAEMYMTRDGSINSNEPRIALNPIWMEKGVCFQNVVGDDCLVCDKRYYPKKTWKTMEYLDRKFNVPSDPEEWLTHRYGDSWKTPQACHWKDNKNYKLYKDLFI